MSERTVRAAGSLPSWMGSIRFRLTLMYSTVLFGLAALVVGGIYLGLARSLDSQDVSTTVRYEWRDPRTGELLDSSEQQFVDLGRFIEQAADEQALATLRQYSFGALLVLFGSSLVVGWAVAGRVLAPIGRITRVAADISGTDLSRRIALAGPDDELTRLADTFDGMLDRLERAFDEQRRFIHEASHELRNPLAVLRTNVEVTLADPSADEAELRHTLEVVAGAGERMTNLVDDLLLYARTGTVARERVPLDAGDVLDDAAVEFRAAAEARRVELVDDHPEGLWVLGDRNALRQAVANLVANAVRLSPPAGTIWLRGGHEAGWVWLSVEDQGPGIPPEQRDLVFQRFWRSDVEAGEPVGDALDTGPRSGLGLTIVRQIAESHNGEVRLASEVGEGTAFAIWLPAADAPNGAKAGDGATAPRGAADDPVEPVASDLR